MSVEIKRRRGTTEEHAYFKGAVGEITIDTTKNTVVVHDGMTLGGHPLAKEKNVEEAIEELKKVVYGTLGSENLLLKKELRSYYETLKVIDQASDEIDIDHEEANVYQVNMSGPIRINMIKPQIPEGKAVAITLILKQATSIKSIVWPSYIKWPKGETPALLKPDVSYVFTLITTNGGESWYGLLVGEEIDI